MTDTYIPGLGSSYQNILVMICIKFNTNTLQLQPVRQFLLVMQDIFKDKYVINYKHNPPDYG